MPSIDIPKVANINDLMSLINQEKPSARFDIDTDAKQKSAAKAKSDSGDDFGDFEEWKESGADKNQQNEKSKQSDGDDFGDFNEFEDIK